LLAAEAMQSKADCKARPTQPSQGKASQAGEPNDEQCRPIRSHIILFHFL